MGGIVVALLLGAAGSAQSASRPRSAGVALSSARGAQSSAHGPLTWSARRLIDRQAPFADGYGLISLACPAQDLCLTVDDRGELLRTSDPAGGRQAWKPLGMFGIGSISCPSVDLCVAAGNGLLVTTAPAGGPGAWHHIRLPGGKDQSTLAGVSCASTRLCVAISQDNRAWVSTNPSGGLSAWHRRTIAGILVGPPVGISCPTEQFCAVAMYAGGVVTSNDPAGASSSWHDHAGVDNQQFLNGISCPSPQLCVVADDGGGVASSKSPATGPWHVQPVEPDGSLSGASCPSAGLCFVFDGQGNVYASRDPTAPGSWSKSQPLPNPHSAVNAISCPTGSLCVAAGDDGYASTTSDPSAARWSGHRIDGFNTLLGVSCTRSWCAAVDDAGDLLTASNPAGGARSWSATRIDPSFALTDISCPSDRLCVAVDSGGAILSSTKPTSGAAAWHRVQVDRGHPLTTITCATRGGARPICVALAGYPIQALPSFARDGSASGLGGADTIFTTDRPTGGARAWREGALDPHGSHHEALDTAACPSVTLCVVGDDAGGLLSSIHPNRGRGAWKEVNLRPRGSGPITGAACPSRRLCVVVDNNGIVIASTHPAGGRAGWRVQVPGGFEHFYPGYVFCPSVRLCLADTVADSYASSDPAGGKRAWHTSSGLPADPPAIACRPRSTLCVAAVSEGFVRTSR